MDGSRFLTSRQSSSVPEFKSVGDDEVDGEEDVGLSPEEKELFKVGRVLFLIFEFLLCKHFSANQVDKKKLYPTRILNAFSGKNMFIGRFTLINFY